jgi:phage terminase large subunit
VSKFATVEATIRNRRVAVLRDEKETIRESILNEIFNRFDSANKYGHFNGLFDKNESGIRNLKTGNMQVFTKGFRASSLEKKTNLKGVSDTDTAIVEEAEDIRSFEKFNTFRDSIRTKNRLIVVILNTPDIQHWIVKRYFNLEVVDSVVLPNGQLQTLDGYWRLVPKVIPGFHCIQSSYLDNEFLPEGVVRDYTAYGNPESPTFDLHYYLTAILGLASSGRKGQVIKKAKPIKLADYLQIDAREIFGQDFGTSAPAGLAGVKIDGNNLYARELNYKPKDTLGLGKLYCELGFTKEHLVIADSADPLSIGQLRRGWKAEDLVGINLEHYAQLLRGFHMFNVVKGPGSIEFGLGKLLSYNLHFVEESDNLWHETYNYIYAQNKEGEYTNIPDDNYNHLIDPIRYVAQSKGRFF